MVLQSPGTGIVAAGAAGIAATMILIRLMSALAPRIGLVDVPDERKHHQGHVPLVGGVAICSAYLAVALFLLPTPETFLPYAAGICLLALGGLLDDLFDLTPRVRLLLQTLAAVIAITGADVQLQSLGNLAALGDIQLSVAGSFLLTLFCIISLINGFNMLDGMDGLAGGIGAIMLGGFIVAGVVMGLVTAVAHMAVFLCCLLGFLLAYNARTPLRRRLVFMGDAGSTAVGFLLACMAIQLAEAPDTGGMYPITAVWILGLVVLDTVATVVRRALQKRSPLSPGRDHLHHLLQELGMSASRVAILMWAFAAAMGGVGLLGWLHAVPEYVLAAAFVVVAALYYAAVTHGWRRVERKRAAVIVRFVQHPVTANVAVSEYERQELKAG